MVDTSRPDTSAGGGAPSIWIIGLTPDCKHQVESDNEVDIERARIKAQFFVDQGTYTKAWVLIQRYEVVPS